MTELVKRLENLFLKLDHTALLAEQMLADALFAVESGKEEDTEVLIQSDDVIDATVHHGRSVVMVTSVGMSVRFCAKNSRTATCQIGEGDCTRCP